jgi:catechol 2,3-dioxygenase-like lactoylglutathione lyase family enzyme
MEEAILKSTKVLQVALLVADAEKTAEKYAKLFGVPVPPVVLSGTYEEALTEYKGKPTPARCKMVFFDLDNIQLEFIEPDGEASNWRDTLNERGEGFHHIAFDIKGMKEQLDRFEQNGVSLVQKGEYPGGRYAFVDSADQYKIMFELLENDR